jgi:hypothetical protein
MRPEIETSRNHAPGALTVWLFVAFLDWVARGLITPSIPARVFICFILVCFAQTVVIARYWNERRAQNVMVQSTTAN